MSMIKDRLGKVWVLSGGIQEAENLLSLDMQKAFAQWNLVYPQQVCQWHQPVWCDQHNGGKGCHAEAHRQVWEVNLYKSHDVQQGQVKCKVLHMDCGNPKHKYKVGGEWTGVLWGEGLCGCWWMRNSTWVSSLQPINLASSARERILHLHTALVRHHKSIQIWMMR